MKKIIMLGLSVMLLVTTVGCSGSDATVTGSSSTEAKGSDTVDSVDEAKFKEAPMLAEMVEAGELPEVELRLPIEQDIMIEEVTDEIGQYGGTLVTTSNDNGRWGWGKFTEQSMFRFKQDGSGEVEPNVAKDFYSNEDATVWTVELREGMKWSDGEPFTADDVIFYYDHMSTPALNEDRTPVDVDDEAYYSAFTSKPYRAYYTVVDEVIYWAEFEKVDDYKFTVTFASPKPNFPESVAIDNKWMFAPKHFYKDIVARKDGITDDPTFPLITEEEALANANEIFQMNWETYSSMARDTGYYMWQYYQIPSLRSFIPVDNNHNQVGQTYELVRNPYFFKTDAEGNQLPYLDAIHFEIINEQDQVTLKAIAGEFDLLGIAPDEFSTIASSTQLTHDVYSWSGSGWGMYTISLNQTVQDEDKRALYQEKDFRQALSHAIDRELVNATLANGQREPWQLSPTEGLLGHDPEWGGKWIEYDIEKSNELLDGLTEPWSGESGTYRKYKGTDREIELVFTLSEQQAADNADFIGIIQSSYREIGIKVVDQIVADVSRMILANEHDVTMDAPEGVSAALRPDSVVPMRNYMGWYGAYGKWFEDNKSEENGGIEPTGDMLALIEAYEAIRDAVGPNRDEIIAENTQKIYNLHKENIWVIGTLSPAPARTLVNKDLKNYPNGLVAADEFRGENLARPEQFFFAK